YKADGGSGDLVIQDEAYIGGSLAIYEDKVVIGGRLEENLGDLTLLGNNATDDKTALTDWNNIVIRDMQDAGISLLPGGSNDGGIIFGDFWNDDNNDIARIWWDTSENTLKLDSDVSDGQIKFYTATRDLVLTLDENLISTFSGDLVVDKEILFDSTPDFDHTASGTKAVFTNGNGSSVNFGDVCYMASDGDLEFGDADANTTVPVVAMALETITTTSSGEWLLQGFVVDASWTWSSFGAQAGLIYLTITATTGNTLSQTAPSGVGDQVQIIGYAKSATEMYFNPNLMLIEIGS
ncbi:MAG: hypothetical protein KAS32_25745, partial [Candidatus Peribacteraceae bacterium]|nr:hypothetical protein [Candidatus Peribacteraceae bacterium]